MPAVTAQFRGAARLDIVHQRNGDRPVPVAAGAGRFANVNPQFRACLEFAESRLLDPSIALGLGWD